MSDYKDMRWNPLDVKEGDSVMEHFTELQFFPALKAKVTGLDSDKCLRFAMFITDQRCPLNKISSFSEMIDKAAELSGFKKTKGKFPQNVEYMLEGKSAEVSDYIHSLFTIHANYRYESWFTMKKNYHYIARTLQAPPDSNASKDMVGEMEKRAKLQRLMRDLSADLAKEEVTLFDNQYVKDAVLRGAAISMDMYAERMAKTGTAI